MMMMAYVLLPGWVSMKPWNSRVLVYRRQELLLLCKLVALLLLQLIQLVEGTKISKAPNPLTNLSYECCYMFVILQFQVRFIQIICTECGVDRSDPFSFWYPLCCQGLFSKHILLIFVITDYVNFFWLLTWVTPIIWLQDVVDPVTDEMLAEFVVNSHFKSQPKGGKMDDSEPQDDNHGSSGSSDPEVCDFQM